MGAATAPRFEASCRGLHRASAGIGGGVIGDVRHGWNVTQYHKLSVSPLPEYFA